MAAASQRAAELDGEWSAMMAAAQTGDRIAYERLLRGCTPLIRRVVMRQGVYADRADDVVQEVLLTIHRARQTYDPARSFSAWLCAIAQRRAIDALRRRGRQDRREVFAPLDYENHPDPSDARQHGMTESMQDASMRGAIDELPDGQREAIEMLALQQMSLDDAAIATGKTKGALKVNMHRALKTLRARFGGDLG
ncbi:sigma-70 family RNA polymerase sigma factor [Lichenifustis flavocetrariae]|uniref:Sigma-70 family RNA polymerase sigma factor n=1 Tax=Lichenifustis flavocetrariae TaxID=2949735 RepID=A0AA42CKU3_9HYPH|nr:sigma-70 family RNA polymerase sigma factor [Lichenifustis flavocetrariae]MCW6506650.1 sigma-70 family RNA polymerase sigma factor [Lichenifustis flavocetrariae]